MLNMYGTLSNALNIHVNWYLWKTDPIKNIWKNNGEISPNLWQNSIKHRVIVRNSKTKGLKTKKSATTEL